MNINNQNINAVEAIIKGKTLSILEEVRKQVAASLLEAGVAKVKHAEHRRSMETPVKSKWARKAARKSWDSDERMPWPKDYVKYGSGPAVTHSSLAGFSSHHMAEAEAPVKVKHAEHRRSESKPAKTKSAQKVARKAWDNDERMPWPKDYVKHGSGPAVTHSSLAGFSSHHMAEQELTEGKSSYTLSSAQAFKHVPEKPELTAIHGQNGALRDGYTYKVFPHTDALHKFLQGSSNHADRWNAWLDSPAGYRHKQAMKEETTLSRDPFARHDVIKQSVPAKSGETCDWCGSEGRNGKLNQYGTSSDGGRKGYSKGKFCSKSCHKSYHS